MYTQAQSLHRRWITGLALLLAAVAASGCGGSDVEAGQTELADRLAALETRLAEREAALAAREAALAEQGLELAERMESAERREQAAKRRMGELDGRTARIAARESSVARQEAAVDENAARLAAQRQEAAEAQAAVQREAERQAEAARRQPAPEVYTEIALAPETLLEVEFKTTVSSATSRVGDTFATRLTKDLHAPDGRLVVPAGTELTGVVTEAVPLKRVGGQALLGLRFGELHLPWGRTVEIDASFYDAGRNESRRDKKIIGGGAAAGAVLGAILDKKEGRGALLGAIVGAAAGTAAAANRPHDQVEIPGGTIVTLELEEGVAVMVPWKSRHAAP